MKTHRTTILTFMVMAFLSTHSVQAQFRRMELQGCTQPLIQAGTEATVGFYGRHLDEIQALHWSEENLKSEVLFHERPFVSSLKSNAGQVKIAVETNASAGLKTYRLHGRYGLSNASTMLVTQQAVQWMSKLPTTPETAMVLEEGLVYGGQFPGANNGFFKLELKQGEHCRVVSYAKHLGSLAVPFISVFSSNGELLGTSRAMGYWPAALEFDAPTTGSYQLVIHDFLYQGGERYPFALEVGVTSDGKSSQLELDQLLSPELSPEAVLKNAFDPTQVFGKSQTSDQSLEEVSSGATVSVPFTGMLDLSSGESSIEFEGQKDQELAFDVQSAQLLQLTDPKLDVFLMDQEKGTRKSILHSNDLGYLGGPEMRLRPLDPAIQRKLPQNGTYLVRVTDNFHRSTMTHQPKAIVRIAPPQPGFSLLAYPLVPVKDMKNAKPYGMRMMRGAKSVVSVHVVRQEGFNQPVELQMKGLPEGASCPPVVVAANQKHGSLIIETKPDCKAWTGQVQVMGVAATEEHELQAEALYAEISIEKLAHRNGIESRLVPDMWFSVTDLETSPLRIGFDTQEVIEVVQGEKAKVVVKLHREEGSKEACTLKVQNLPPNCKLSDIKVEKDKRTAEGELSVSDKTTPGNYSFWMLAETKVRWRENPQILDRETEYLKQLKSLREESQEDAQKKAMDEQIKKTDDEIKRLRKETAEKTISVWIPTSSQTVLVKPKPKS